MDVPYRPAAPIRLARYLHRRLRLFSDDLMIAALILVVLIVFMLPSMVVTIPAGKLGVKWKRFDGGTVINETVPEGTTVIWPWDKVFIYDARLQSVDRDFDVLSSDGLKLKVNLAWRYRIITSKLPELHQYAGPDYAETLLAPSVGARARDVIAIYRPEDIYTSHRLEIQNQISASVRYDLKHRFTLRGGVAKELILLEDVLVKRIELPPGVQESIVRKNMARHEVEQYALIVEKELKETERKRVEALGIRNFQEIVGQGLTEPYLRWRGIEATLELARSKNAKVVIMGNNKTGGLPLISVGTDDAKGTPAPAPARGSPKPDTASGAAGTDEADASGTADASETESRVTRPALTRPDSGNALRHAAPARAVADTRGAPAHQP